MNAQEAYKEAYKASNDKAVKYLQLVENDVREAISDGYMEVTVHNVMGNVITYVIQELEKQGYRVEVEQESYMENNGMSFPKFKINISWSVQK
ncbi:hypothetical protein ABVF11_02290 [Pediococcus argentinicus]|uniref:hypothetical protein n=1 Tax=Pediococcus argentinicus TaxID=480391 RepID=UPI00338F0A3F